MSIDKTTNGPFSTNNYYWYSNGLVFKTKYWLTNNLSIRLKVNASDVLNSDLKNLTKQKNRHYQEMWANIVRNQMVQQ